jgi:Putative metal-binding domain of cation transport ATPase
MAALSLDVASPVYIAATDGGASCHDCGEANPAGTDWRLNLDGAERAFCCAGCRAVAQTLRAEGLASYQQCRPASCLSAARSSSLTVLPWTWSRPSSCRRDSNRLMVSSLRPR